MVAPLDRAHQRPKHRLKEDARIGPKVRVAALALEPGANVGHR
jgi:hypothetical protein